MNTRYGAFTGLLLEIDPDISASHPRRKDHGPIATSAKKQDGTSYIYPWTYLVRLNL
jgi:hypothetical protein